MYGKRELRSEKSEEAELWDERKKSLPGFNKDVIIFRHGLFSIALVAVCVCVCFDLSAETFVYHCGGSSVGEY